MATVTINASGVGAAQSGGAVSGTSILIVNDTDAAVTFDVTTGGSTVEQSGITIQKKDFTILSGLANAAKTLTSVKTAHGTVAQKNEKLYIHLAS